MAKPTRKHPSISILDDSPQGEQFLQFIVENLGGDIKYTAVASFDGGRRHLFRLDGSQGSGVLAEAWEEPQGAETRPVLAFAAHRSPEGEVFAELRGQRWDAGTYLAISGEPPFPDVTKAEAKRLERQKRRDVAAEKDEIRTDAGPHAWDQLAGISRNEVEEAIDLSDLETEGRADSGERQASRPWVDYQAEVQGLDDPGEGILDTLSAQLMFDPEWTSRSSRSLDWWGAPLPLRITVGPPRRLFGDPAVKVTASVQVTGAVNHPLEQTYKILAATNAYSTGWMYWIDPGSLSIHTAVTHYAHEGNSSVIQGRTFALLMLLTYGAAVGKAPHFQEALRAHMEAPEHPRSGTRVDFDELASYSDFVAASRGQPNPWVESDFQSDADWLNSHGAFSFAGSSGLSAEFPFTGSNPAAFQSVGTAPAQTSLLTMNTDAENPQFGAGLFTVLKLPLALPADEAFVLANGLNWAEANEGTGFPSWGAWTIEPGTEDDPTLCHVMFSPDQMFKPGMSGLIAFQNGLRNSWAQERLLDEAWVAQVRAGEL